ncbi:MAG TPA: protein kinase [Stenomitos sp.]
MNWKAALICAMLLGAPVSGALPVLAQITPAEQAWTDSLQTVDNLVAAGKSDEAAQRLESLLKTAPRLRSSEVHLRLASIFAQRHEWETAIGHGQDAIRAWPENGWIYLPVARILVEAGRPEAAVSLCTEASRHDPAVRLAAQDLIYQIRSGTLGASAPSSAPSPRPAPTSNLPFSWIIAVLVVLLLQMGGMILWLLRRQRPKAAPTAPTPAPASRVEQTGPVTYNPVGVRLQEPGDVIDHYRIVRVVGSSLHSVLYCAEDTKLNRQVALKQVGAGAAASDAVMSRFQKEVQSLIALSNHHDGVVKVYDFLEPATLVTEWVEGENLEESAQLPADAILEIGIALCDVLSFAHERGIVHRDIKPSNVMLTAHTHHVKLLDFGIAKNTSLGTSNLTLDANVPIGTFTYMPPEQFAAPNQAKPPSDIYSLGLTLYRLITSEMPTEPWLGPRTFGFVPADMFRPITVASPGIAMFLEQAGLPAETAPWVEELNAIIRRAYEENPSERYPDAVSFKRALEGIWHKMEALRLG